MEGKRLRYCGKCKSMWTVTYKDFLTHNEKCDGTPVQKKKVEPVIEERVQMRARDLRNAKERRKKAAPREPVARAPRPAPVPDVHPKITPHIEKYGIGAMSYCGLVSDRKHLKMEVLEIYQQPDMVKELEDVDANELIEMQKKADWTDGILDRWFGWGDSKAFSTPEAMVSPLTSVVSYAEGDATASPDIKPKLRYVTKCLRSDPAMDPRDIIIMLACHGGVCHVQKEIAVRMAFGSLAGTLKSDCDANNPKNTVLRLLIEAREACIENLYRAQYLNGSSSLNSHGLVAYRNAVHEEIGLARIPDVHASDIALAKHYVDIFFQRFYHVDEMLARVMKALNAHPRRMHYNSVVSFLQYNRPKKFESDPDEFLYHCFDLDGQFTRGAAAWMLYKMDIFSPIDPIAKVEESLFPKLPDATMDEIRASRDRLLSGDLFNNSPLASSKGKEELDELRQSVERHTKDHICVHNEN